MYRKQTYTGQLLNFNALRPDKWGKGLIIYLLNIAKQLCLSDTLFNNKVDELRKIFKPNSYPISHFNKIFDSFLNSSVTLNCDSYEEVDYVSNLKLWKRGKVDNVLIEILVTIEQ